MFRNERHLSISYTGTDWLKTKLCHTNECKGEYSKNNQFLLTIWVGSVNRNALINLHLPTKMKKVREYWENARSLKFDDFPLFFRSWRTKTGEKINWTRTWSWTFETSRRTWRIETSVGLLRKNMLTYFNRFSFLGKKFEKDSIVNERKAKATAT